MWHNNACRHKIHTVSLILISPFKLAFVFIVTGQQKSGSNKNARQWMLYEDGRIVTLNYRWRQSAIGGVGNAAWLGLDESGLVSKITRDRCHKWEAIDRKNLGFMWDILVVWARQSRILDQETLQIRPASRRYSLTEEFKTKLSRSLQ